MRVCACFCGAPPAPTVASWPRPGCLDNLPGRRGRASRVLAHALCGVPPASEAGPGSPFVEVEDAQLPRRGPGQAGSRDAPSFLMAQTPAAQLTAARADRAPATAPSAPPKRLRRRQGSPQPRAYAHTHEASACAAHTPVTQRRQRGARRFREGGIRKWASDWGSRGVGGKRGVAPWGRGIPALLHSGACECAGCGLSANQRGAAASPRPRPAPAPAHRGSGRRDPRRASGTVAQ